MDLASSPFAPVGIRPAYANEATPGSTADADTATTGSAAAQGPQLFGEDGLDFFDFLDVVNPLQHIPVISTIYRMATGDEIGSLPRLMGGVLFGGLPGLGAASVNVALDHATGKDIGEHVVTAFLGDENGNITPPVMVAELPAADAPWYASGVVIYSRNGEQTDTVITADAGTVASDAQDSAPVTLASRPGGPVPWYMAGKNGLTTGAGDETATVVVAKAEPAPAPISPTDQTPSPTATAQPQAGLGRAPVDAVEVMDLPPAPATTTPVSATPAPVTPAPVIPAKTSAAPIQNPARTSATAQTAPLSGGPGQTVTINNNLDAFLKAFANNGGNTSAAVATTREQAAGAPQVMPMPTQNATVTPQGVNPAVVAAQANGGGVVSAPPPGGVSNTLFRPPSPDQLPPSLNPMGAHRGLIHTPQADYAKAMMTGLDKYQAAVDRGDVGPSRIYIGADIDKLEVFTFWPIAAAPSTDWM